MTFSILVRDENSGALGAAAATGSLCVGGWVLRGHLKAGLSASQGAAPSTFWGEDVLQAMQDGQPAADAVAAITDTDPGRGDRQLAALDLTGGTGAFTGDDNTDWKGALAFDGGIATGNMLTGPGVLEGLVEPVTGGGPLDKRLLAALRGAEAAGGDSRGLLSAALLVLHPDRPPLTLRVDHHETDPIGAMEALHARATSGDYADWARQVPVMTDPCRILDR
ncbi:DUF1028 domain-containing protein [Chachezhania antarctica]|uniref:DUF1028 domain-containing protein n=1 Tax=Chachezhania antarctica TaxID=2340860 RepID=UPI000EAC73BD|nr:DUF1028 domain-containing protein [Chachezhania antarctica]|tara:strand:+ start:5548 stop:6213 length:666 start_codon:yes stop_codon:yes gene_type:complete